MTFCPNCGVSLTPGAPGMPGVSPCPRCGRHFSPPRPIYPAYPVHQQNAPIPATNTFAVLGFVMAFLPIPFAWLVLCVMGLVQCGRPGPDGQRQKGRGLAVAGIVLRVVCLVLLVAGIAVAVWYFTDTGYYLPDYWEWDNGFSFA